MFEWMSFYKDLKLNMCYSFIFSFSGLQSWSSGHSDYFQYLTLKFHSRKIIHLIATQGQKDSKEFVSEYCVQFSYDGDTWRTYVASDGSTQV